MRCIALIPSRHVSIAELFECDNWRMQARGGMI